MKKYFTFLFLSSLMFSQNINIKSIKNNSSSNSHNSNPIGNLWIDINHSSTNGLGFGIGSMFYNIGIEWSVLEKADYSTNLNYYVPHGSYYIEEERASVTPLTGVDLLLAVPIYGEFFLNFGVGGYYQATSEVHVSKATGWQYTPKGTMEDNFSIAGSVGIQYIIDGLVLLVKYHSKRNIVLGIGYAY